MTWQIDWDQVEMQLIAAIVAAACALPGVFLVLRRMALMSDAISHAILLGIAVAALMTHTVQSPWLLIGATLTGVVLVSLVELVNKTGLVREDAAIGLVFPVLFSIGVILISRHAQNIHLDTDAVLLGDLLNAPFRRVPVPFLSNGLPYSLVVMSLILLVNLAFVAILYKELKLSTFDAGLAASLGFAPGLLHYLLMTLVSVTCVGAFDAVGSILVVACMIGPPATAYLFTDRLGTMIGLSVVIGVIGALAGFWLSWWLDASTAGTMAAMIGVLFGLTFIFAPGRGVFAQWIRRRRQSWEFARTMLAIHLLNHEGKPEMERESRVQNLEQHLRWRPGFVNQVVSQSERQGYVVNEEGLLALTEKGRELARSMESKE